MFLFVSVMYSLDDFEETGNGGIPLLWPVPKLLHSMKLVWRTRLKRLGVFCLEWNCSFSSLVFLFYFSWVVFFGPVSNSVDASFDTIASTIVSFIDVAAETSEVWKIKRSSKFSKMIKIITEKLQNRPMFMLLISSSKKVSVVGFVSCLLAC